MERKIDPEKLVEVFEKHGGDYEKVATEFGVTRWTVTAALRRRPEIKQILMLKGLIAYSEQGRRNISLRTLNSSPHLLLSQYRDEISFLEQKREDARARLAAFYKQPRRNSEERKELDKLSIDLFTRTIDDFKKICRKLEADIAKLQAKWKEADSMPEPDRRFRLRQMMA